MGLACKVWGRADVRVYSYTHKYLLPDVRMELQVFKLNKANDEMIYEIHTVAKMTNFN